MTWTKPSEAIVFCCWKFGRMKFLLKRNYKTWRDSSFVVVVVNYGDDDNGDTVPESIDKWKAEIRLELGADHWNEGGQDCT